MIVGAVRAEIRIRQGPSVNLDEPSRPCSSYSTKVGLSDLSDICVDLLKVHDELGSLASLNTAVPFDAEGINISIWNHTGWLFNWSYSKIPLDWSYPKLR